MKTKSAAAPGPVKSREEILAAIRSAVERAGGERVSLAGFVSSLGLRRWQVYRFFRSWDDALACAGYRFERRNRPVGTEALLTDWGRVVRKLGRPPTYGEYNNHGAYNAGTCHRRFGSWSSVPSAFRAYAGTRPEWDDVLAMLPSPDGFAPACGRAPGLPTSEIPVAIPRDGRPCYGEPLNFPGLLNAPANESGVIFAFGLLAPRLGFQIRSMQAAFPDCEAMRRVGETAWQDVKIEFEFLSGNFALHKHPPGECDLIVCWKHNWTDCPKTLEVIALDEELKRLGRA